MDVEKIYGKMLEAVERTKSRIAKHGYDPERYFESWASTLVVLEKDKERILGDLQERLKPLEELGWTAEDINVVADVYAYVHPTSAEFHFMAPSGAEVSLTIYPKVTTFTKEEYERYQRLLKELEEFRKRLEEQWEAFKASKGYALYNWEKWEKLDEEGQKRYDELMWRLKNEVLSDEELREVIKELETLMKVVETKETMERVQYLEEKVKKLEEENRKLKERLDILREFIVAHHDAKDLIEFLKRGREENLEEEVRAEAEKLVPKLFEDEDDY